MMRSAAAWSAKRWTASGARAQQLCWREAPASQLEIALLSAWLCARAGASVRPRRPSWR